MTRRALVDAQHLTERAYKTPTKPAIGRELAGQHYIGGVSVGLNPAHARILEDRVRRWANRHGCHAPAKLREALAAASGDGPDAVSAARLAVKISANPGAYCGDPRHAADAAWLADTLELLGLRDTTRRRPKRNGRCPECGRVHSLRLDGTLTAHKLSNGDTCPGKGSKPVEEATAS
ncbi:hypothetical protein [Actinomadura geliboluensis]|uniref:hypothetical protein n=1 Tax=Actinomadura geliboluensis TaxID=882440 RepID=UPI0036A1AE60